nr:MAG TPA: hypothetical protein [Caudoviricetes sp.]
MYRTRDSQIHQLLKKRGTLRSLFFYPFIIPIVFM